MKRSTLYRMKDKALKAINGSHDESYKWLPAYCEMVKQTNPGSIGHCVWIPTESPEKPLQFKSIFVSFKAHFEGLIAGCRSLIGVDGAHLKGMYGGVLLSAISLDVNEELFLITVCVVESKNKASWTSFFWQLKNLLKDSKRSDWAIISDRQKGIDGALETVWPEVGRRFCARHLCQNFMSDFRGLMMHKLFWNVVNSTSVFSFKKALEKIVQVGGLGCATWFSNLGEHEHWVKYAFDPKIACDHNTSNFVESFNNTLRVHRSMSILSTLEGIRRMAMVRHVTRQQITETWHDDVICPNILARLKVLTKESKFCNAYSSSKGEYEVHEGKSSLHISLNNGTCAYGLWQISDIPCKHAIKAICSTNNEPKDYVSKWYSVKRYKAAYILSISHIPDKDQWPEFNVPTLDLQH